MHSSLINILYEDDYSVLPPMPASLIKRGVYFYGAFRNWSEPKLLVRTWDKIVEVENPMFTWDASPDLLIARYTPVDVTITASNVPSRS